MAVSKKDFMGLFHYVDDQGFGGDIEVHADDADTLFARLADVQNKALTRKFHGRPADKDKAPSTYVKVGERKPPVKAAPRDADPMMAAAQATGLADSRSCPVCGENMKLIRNLSGGRYKTGNRRGQVWNDFYKCDNCQKSLEVEPEQSTEVPV